MNKNIISLINASKFNGVVDPEILVELVIWECIAVARVVDYGYIVSASDAISEHFGITPTPLSSDASDQDHHKND